MKSLRHAWDLLVLQENLSMDAGSSSYLEVAPGSSLWGQGLQAYSCKELTQGTTWAIWRWKPYSKLPAKKWVVSIVWVLLTNRVQPGCACCQILWTVLHCSISNELLHSKRKHVQVEKCTCRFPHLCTLDKMRVNGHNSDEHPTME